MKENTKLKWPGLEEFISGVLLMIISVAVFIQVVNRYLIGASIPWTEELARYSFLWITFIGVSLGVKRNSHLSVDIIKNFLGKIPNNILSLVIHLIFLIFCIVVAVIGFKVVGQMMEYGQRSPALGIEMGYVYLCVPVGLTLTSIRIVQKVARIIRGKEKAV